MPNELGRSVASSVHTEGYCCEDCTNKDRCGTNVFHLTEHAHAISGSEMPDEGTKSIRSNCDCTCETSMGWWRERTQPSGSNSISWEDSWLATQ
jgi:hypothetical protein